MALVGGGQCQFLSIGTGPGGFWHYHLKSFDNDDFRHFWLRIFQDIPILELAMAWRASLWGKSCSPEAHQLVHWDVQWIWQPRNGWCSGLQLRPQYRNMLFEWSNCIFTWVTVSVDSLKVPTWWTSSGRTMELFAVPFMTRWFALRGCSLLFSLSDVQQLWLCRCHQQKGVQRRLSYNLGCWALDQISASKEPRRVCMCSGSCKSSLKSHTTQSKNSIGVSFRNLNPGSNIDPFSVTITNGYTKNHRHEAHPGCCHRCVSDRRWAEISLPFPCSMLRLQVCS